MLKKIIGLAFLLAIAIIILYFFTITKVRCTNVREGFDLPPGVTNMEFKDLSPLELGEIKGSQDYDWPYEKEQALQYYEDVVNNNAYEYDMNMVQQQANEKEADFILKYGYWPWSEETKYLYMDAVQHHPIIKVQPSIALKNAMVIYNEEAAKRLLSWNTKEGEFLLNGVTIGTNQNLKDTIKCGINKSGDPVPIKTTYNGFNVWNGYKNSKAEEVSPSELPSLIKGFSFVNEPCNPCLPLTTDKPNYSCPFKIKTGPNDDGTISKIWKILWGLNS